MSRLAAFRCLEVDCSQPLALSTVFDSVTRSIPQAETFDPRGGYAVRRPHASDALGTALRGAFGSDDRLPGDIALLLGRLDAVPKRC